MAVQNVGVKQIHSVVEPCVKCGRSTRPVLRISRPPFEVGGRSAEQDERVEAWLAVTPTDASFCYEHLPTKMLLSAGVEERLYPPLVYQAMTNLWFSVFGHPLAAHRGLWRPAKRTKIFSGPTAEDLEKRRRMSEVRKSKNRRRRQIRRLAYSVQKFLRRGRRRHEFPAYHRGLREA